MKKVCFILPNSLPVPAVMGGAIETLIEDIINENEQKKLIDITCVSIDDELAREKSKKYKNCKFIFIKQKLLNILPVKNVVNRNFYHKVLNRIGCSPQKLYDKIIFNKIKNEKFDAIFMEGGDLLGYPSIMKIKDTIKVGRIHGPMQPDNRLSIYNYLIGVSDFIGKLLITDEVTSSKIKTLYNGIDISKFDKESSSQEKKKLKFKLGISNDDKVLIFCGRLAKEKGIKELILSFKKVLKKEPKTKLLIVGSSNFKENIKTPFEKDLLTISSDILENIIFTGFVDNKDLHKYYYLADISVIPSMIDEAFCLVAAEAMACSLPIIASNMGALPEIMDNSNCIFVKNDKNFVDNYAKEIVALLNDESKRKEMSKNSKKTSYKYTSQRLYDNLCNILDEIVED